jgi:DNA-binding MarR family transcriptional regulator
LSQEGAVTAETPRTGAPVSLALGQAAARQQAAVHDFDREVGRLLGVNETDLRCLEILLEEEPESAPTQLAERLGLTTGSVTAMLDRLAARGYITRTPHPSDRRRTLIRATPEASRRAYELLTPLVEEGTQDLLTRYSTAELEVITDFLRRDTDLHQRHTHRLRALPTPAPAQA